MTVTVNHRVEPRVRIVTRANYHSQLAHWGFYGRLHWPSFSVWMVPGTYGTDFDREILPWPAAQVTGWLRNGAI